MILVGLTPRFQDTPGKQYHEGVAAAALGGDDNLTREGVMLHRVRPFLLFSIVVVLSLTMLGVSAAAHAKAPRNGQGVVLVAKRQLGIPYQWGGADRSGFDSSGLVLYVFGRLGVHLPHGADLQADLGRRVGPGHLRPGDAVFWGTAKYYSHVAIYVGHGRIIDAPHTGAVVSVERLKGEVTARRYLPAT